MRAEYEQTLLDHIGKADSEPIQLKAELVTDDQFNNYIRIEL